VTRFSTRRSIEPVVTSSADASALKSYVDPINLAWLRMHASLDQINELRIGGAESTPEHDDIAPEALLASTPLSRTRRVGDPELHSPLARQRAM
jgi:hypothetical protein